jgi:polyisoprenoid-binding protein YceI
MGQTIETGVLFGTDARASQFTVQVFSGGLLSAFGHSPTIAIQDFVGEVRLNPDMIERSSLKVTVKAASLAVKDDVSDKDRREIERMMREEILETEGYPDIVFESANIAASKLAEGKYSVTINGELTLHGITRDQAVSGRVTVAGDTLRGFGNFTLLQTDYGLKLASVAGGALKVKDELKFSFNVMARKQG